MIANKESIKYQRKSVNIKHMRQQERQKHMQKMQKPLSFVEYHK